MALGVWTRPVGPHGVGVSCSERARSSADSAGAPSPSTAPSVVTPPVPAEAPTESPAARARAAARAPALLAPTRTLPSTRSPCRARLRDRCAQADELASDA